MSYDSIIDINRVEVVFGIHGYLAGLVSRVLGVTIRYSTALLPFKTFEAVVLIDLRP